uniref:Uncharacterized protein n=1 Tax=Anguilla anguilla TaxID=7936 RepID=A0A0E9QT53_ANGAN
MSVGATGIWLYYWNFSPATGATRVCVYD